MESSADILPSKLEVPPLVDPDIPPSQRTALDVLNKLTQQAETQNAAVTQESKARQSSQRQLEKQEEAQEAVDYINHMRHKARAQAKEESSEVWQDRRFVPAPVNHEEAASLTPAAISTLRLQKKS